MNTTFEKNKLINHLGSLTNVFAEHEVFVGGGAITSLFNGKEINDIDVYFRSEEHLAKFIYDVFENKEGWVVSHTKKATLVKSKGIEVQMIHFRYFETPQEIFDTFDFSICMGVYDFKAGEFVFHDDFMKHNSQRILKFNKGTAFPLISLLRVQKYKERGYTISKPEMLRIAMTCMMLKINSWEELKDQLGGMYGVSFDKLFKDVENEEFDMSVAIDKIADIVYDEDYFNMPEQVEFEDADDLIDNIIQGDIKFMEVKDEVYRIRGNGEIKKVRNSYDIDIPFFDETWEKGKPCDGWVKVDANEFFASTKFYKFVKPLDGKLVSYYNKKFEYKIGEEIFSTGYGLFFNEWCNIDSSTYASEKDKVLIEVEIKAEDFKSARNSAITAGKCKVIRIVPEEEYKDLL